MNILGIDIGGTKSSVCVGDENGRIRVAERMPSQSADPPEAYFVRLFELCDRVLAGAGLEASALDAVGVAAPGPMSKAKGMVYEAPNMPGWADVAVVERLAERFDCPVYIDNDANACALAEYYFGSHRGTPNLLYLTNSTGIGGGLILNGQLVHGMTDMGGEVGHFPLELNGPACTCGLRGCFEIYCGGRSVAHRLRERIERDGVDTAITAHAGGRVADIDFRAFAAAVQEGDAFAVAEWQVYTDRLAQGIAILIMTLNPAVIVLGTIAVHVGDLQMRPLREKLARSTWSWPYEACEVVASELGSGIGDAATVAVALYDSGRPPATMR